MEFNEALNLSYRFYVARKVFNLQCFTLAEGIISGVRCRQFVRELLRVHNRYRQFCEFMTSTLKAAATFRHFTNLYTLHL